MKIQKKLLIILAVAAFIIISGMIFLILSTKKSDGKSVGSVSVEPNYLNDNIATTTPTFLTTTSASTTAELIMLVADAKHIDLNINFKASTTASVLKWINYFSMDDSNRNWYAENGYTASSNILSTEGATPLVHSWTPGTTDTSYKNRGINPVASKYVKTRFWTENANGSLYVEGIPQIENNY
jgi:hypothetical protein